MLDYKRPDGLRPGRVLVVGASATGIQIADELLRSGREVTVAVGEHVRMPRTYRGRGHHVVARPASAASTSATTRSTTSSAPATCPRRSSSARRTATDLDLNALTSRGAELVGRLAAVRDGTRLLLRRAAQRLQPRRPQAQPPARAPSTRGPAEAGLGDAGRRRPAPTRVPDGATARHRPRRRAATRPCVWATGFRADYSWLELPVLDRKGEIRHDGGVVRDAPGLYRIGLNFLRRRKSSFIHGAERRRDGPRRPPRRPPRRDPNRWTIPYQTLCSFVMDAHRRPPARLDRAARRRPRAADERAPRPAQ